MMKRIFIALIGFGLLVGGSHLSFAKGKGNPKIGGSSQSTKPPKSSVVDTGSGSSDGSNSSTSDSTVSCTCGGSSGGTGALQDPAPPPPIDNGVPGDTTSSTPIPDGSTVDSGTSCGGSSGGGEAEQDPNPPTSNINGGPSTPTCESSAFAKYVRCLNNGGENRICRGKLIHNLHGCD